MTPEQLDAIEARANAATPGPWTPSHHPNDPYHWAVFDTDTRALTANRGGCPDDADFIAHAREDIATLLDEVVRLNDLLAKRPDQFFGQGVVLGVPPLPPPLTKPYLPGPDFIRKLNQDRNQNPRNNP